MPCRVPPITFGEILEGEKQLISLNDGEEDLCCRLESGRVSHHRLGKLANSGGGTP
jgi:hypothetical protein